MERKKGKKGQKEKRQERYCCGSAVDVRNLWEDSMEGFHIVKGKGMDVLSESAEVRQSHTAELSRQTSSQTDPAPSVRSVT
jgi:hypothetical protein